MAARLTTYLVAAIVAVTLIAGLIVGAQRDDNSGPVDLIIHNAHVYLADDHGTIEQAIAIRGNKILHVGSDRDVLRYRRPQTRVIDAKGAAVLPGFNDAHASLIAEGLALDELPLAGITSPADLEQKLTDWTGAHPGKAWVVGRGWTRQSFPEDLTRTQLDAVVKDRPVILYADDARTAWVNSEALRAARLGRRVATPAVEGVARDRRGDPTGVLQSDAIAAVRDAMPSSDDGRGQALMSALREAGRHGITSVHDFLPRPEDFEYYQRLAQDEGDSRVARIYVAAPVRTAADLPALDRFAAALPDDPMFKTGLAYLQPSPSDLARLTTDLDRRGWQIAVDVPDAAAVTAALTAYEQAAKANANRVHGDSDRRHRLEGVREIDSADLPRLKDGRWIASLAPRVSPAEDAGGLPDAPPSLELLHAPMRTLVHAGARLVFGSQAPDQPADPLAAIAATLALAAPADEALTIKSAINGWTSGSAWASFDERRKGTLQPGMLADLVMLSKNIFSAPDAIGGAVVDLTIFDGRIIYRRNAS